MTGAELNAAEREELERLRLAMRKLNRLRSNVIATQNASWSNSVYPLVAILGEAGFEVQGATEKQEQEHLHCYGGAGRTPTLLDESPRQPFDGKKSPPKPPDNSGSVQIHAERWRQENDEGWDADHDDDHDLGELLAASDEYVKAALRLLNEEPEPERPPIGWPWHRDWWKPSPDPIRNLVKAGALIAAEIDRLQRLDNPRPGDVGGGA